MRVIKLLLLLICTGLIHPSFAEGNGYHIKVDFDHTDDTMVYLVHYYGKPLPTIYKTDSAQIDKSGKAVFQSDQELIGGIYMILMGNRQNYFELLLDNGDAFSMKVDVQDLPTGITYKNSPKNNHFLSYVAFLEKFSKDQQTLQEELKTAKNAEDSTRVKTKIATSSKALLEYRENFIQNNPGTLLATIFSALSVPRVPEGKHLLPDGSEDSLFAYRFYKEHFWDGFNFQDDRLINTPIYDQKLDEYFNRLVPPIPDSMIAEADRILAQTKGQKELFKYSLWWITRNAETSKIMGMDKVFVYLVENYFMKGEAYWLDNEALGKYYDRAAKIAPNLIGRVGAEIKMKGLDGKVHALSDIKSKYTLLVFWDPTCGHCTKEIPAIDSLYEAALKDKGVTIYGVRTESDVDVWKDFIKKHNLNDWINVYDPDHTSDYRMKYDVYSTPYIYLLDEKKIIRGKKLDHTNILDVIHMLERKQEQSTQKS